MRQFLRLLVDKQARKDYSPPKPEDESPTVRPLPTAVSLSLSSPAPQDSGFFRLPAEIRQAILTHAFGGHYVHINMLPLSLKDLEEERFSRYDNRTAQQKRRHSLWSEEQRRRAVLMCWKGCICERTLPGDPTKRALHNERCLHGEGRCIDWPRSGPKSESIAAMGFLLSCRQGYLDLVNIMYSENTIILNTDLLIDAILRQAVPDGPRIISTAIHHTTSLELLVHFRLFMYHPPSIAGSDPAEIPERQRFRLFLDQLAQAFPHLRTLHICFNYGLFYEYRNMRYELENIRAEIAEPLRKLGEKLHLRKFSVSLETHLFNLFRGRSGWNDADDDAMLESEGPFGLRAWYPWETPDAERGRPGAGFWVRKGSHRMLYRPDERALRYDDVCCPGCHRGCLGTSDLTSKPVLGPVVSGEPAQEPTYDISLLGRYVTLVPVSPDHAEDLYAQLQGPDSSSLFDYLFDDPYTSVEDLRTSLSGKRATTNPWTYAILLNSTSPPQAVGMASLMRMDRPNRVIEVGSILYTKKLQQTPAATEAMYLLASYVFDTLGFRRYEWKCNDLNAPSRRAAVRLGFTYEGTFRQHMIAKGRNRDTAWFAILDQEWPAVKKAMEGWLDPENFDAEGKQKKRLEEFRV